MREYSWQQVAIVGITFSFVGLYGYGMYNIISPFLSPKEENQNVLGNEKPETYIEVNGVKYYSHIDGKEISDLVKE